MAHGTLYYNDQGRPICALPAAVITASKLVPCRQGNAPWKLAIIGTRAPRKITLEPDGEILAHVVITGFVKPLQDTTPTLHFHPSIVAGHLVLPLDYNTTTSVTVDAWELSAHGQWQRSPATIGDPVYNDPAGPYRVFENAPDTGHVKSPAPSHPAPSTSAAKATPVQSSLFKTAPRDAQE